jgi:surfeit locus 1 family protein
MQVDIPPSATNPGQARSTITLWLLGLAACILFFSFIALGTWQVKRLIWKTDLIARVNSRVNAPATTPPPRDLWNNVNAVSDEYRHVQVSGVLLPQFTVRVSASTVYGRGFWVMMPLQMNDGNIIWINRGFIAFGAKPGPDSALTSINFSGLMRMNEPGGALLRPNHPERQEWNSRDVLAMSAQAQLKNAAPFFIDAEAAPEPAGCEAGQCSNHPVGGLTVIAFNNNHLVYLLTWYGLALMVAGGVYIAAKSEIRLRRSFEDCAD